MALDLCRGREVLCAQYLLGVTLTLDADVERTEVVEHHTIAVKQGLGDGGFDTCQHSLRVRLFFC